MHSFSVTYAYITIRYILLQDAQLSQRDRAAGCIIVLSKSGRVELRDIILQIL